MSRAFASLSGTYNVRASECVDSGRQKRGLSASQLSGLGLTRRLLLQDKSETTIKCRVRLLDDSQHVFVVDRGARGSDLLALVFSHVNLVESDFFGLQFRHSKRWLEPQKRVRKQSKDSSEDVFLELRVKFFVRETHKLLEEFTRFQYVLQLRRDIVERRVRASDHVLALLASYVMQAELGDHSGQQDNSSNEGYAHLYPLAPPTLQTKEFNRKAEQLHRAHQSLTPADAELKYLELAFKSLELYGQDLHEARDQRGRAILLGVSGAGLAVMEDLQDGSGVTCLNEWVWAKIVKISFKRKQFFVQLRREGSERFDHVLGFTLHSYRACKSLWKACVEQHTFFRLQSPKPHTKKFFFFFSLGSRFRYSGKTEFQTLEDNRQRLTRAERTFVRTRSSRLARQTVPLPTNHIQNLMQTSHANSQSPMPNGVTPPTRTSRVSESDSSRPKSAWTDRSSSSQSLTAFCPSQALPFIDTPLQESRANHVTDSTPRRLSLSSSETDTCSPSHVTLIRIQADTSGRFGFNVKGGSDQKCPVLVSRVAPNTPAQQSGLKEGDQLLRIDGQEVNELTHAHIVQLIRTRGKQAESELSLHIRPNVYSLSVDEPVFQYIPTDTSPLRGEEQSAKEESLLLLREQLESGALLLQFEQLQRKKTGETMASARLEDNSLKNRYRDISPYDSTRVILRDSLSGDYINASHVVMHVPHERALNRYIATQGPLKDTRDDFWLMCWEQHAPLVVMVTPLEEKGRSKCHKYWPEVGSEAAIRVHNLLTVQLDKEVDTDFGVERHFTLSKTKELRPLIHLQYLAWPDHGVPDRDQHFLELMARVRRVRHEHPCTPFVVHCSAGIGRTGVLILMETGLDLLDANHPVFPLELVRQMREQRAMLIQTQQQFRFVCECLSRCH